MKILLALVLLVWHCGYSAANDEVELLKTINIPGNQIDRSGLDQEVEPGIQHDVFGGISALEYTGKDNLYFALPDRGPKDGAVDWTCRFHVLQIDVLNASPQKRYSIEKTTLFSGPEGRRFTGLSTIYQQTKSEYSRLDPEGIRIDGQGDMWVSEEYGPHLLQFSSGGKLQKHFEVPARFKIENPGPDKKTENANNDSGRAGNKGMEGLAISADGKFLFGLMQSPLLQDCRRNKKGKPIGMNCRLLKMEIETGATSEYLYRLDNHKNKLNEILSIGNEQFLVIERDGEIGSNASFKKIMKIDLAGATKIDQLEKLPPEKLPPGINAIKKEVFIDLLDPEFGLAGSDMPEKIESLTFGPTLEDGRKQLLVASDNDFITENPTKIYCFAVGNRRTSSASKDKKILTSR